MIDFVEYLINNNQLSLHDIRLIKDIFNGLDINENNVCMPIDNIEQFIDNSFKPDEETIDNKGCELE